MRALALEVAFVLLMQTIRDASMYGNRFRFSTDLTILSISGAFSTTIYVQLSLRIPSEVEGEAIFQINIRDCFVTSFLAKTGDNISSP